VLIAALPFALQITALCYIDSLLTVRILDRITGRTSRPNQELAAQGFANGILALIGGVPGAMATERSVMAVREGATMRIAGIAVGVFALIQLLLLQDLIGFIPEAVFSGVLFRLGYDVFDFLPMRLYFKELAKGRLHIVENWLDRHDDEPIFVTHIEMALIVATMVITGVFNLIAAVVIATLVFYFVQKTIAHGEPLRDLKPFTETRPTYEEIH
jgi:SulP family sulfate permease